MDASIEEGILKSSTSKEEAEKLLKENQPLKAATVEEVGIAWASDAIRDALSKGTPQECKFYLDSLRVMALQLLANECFNFGLGVGKLDSKGAPVALSWKVKRYSDAMTNIHRSIESRVNQLIKMQKEGKLQLATSSTAPESTPIEDAIEAESKVVNINGSKYPEQFGDN